MIDLFENIKKYDNQTITIIYNNVENVKIVVNLLSKEIEKNNFIVKIKEIDYKTKIININNINKENVINIYLKYVNTFSDNIYGNVPNGILYISSFVLYLKDDIISVIKSRTNHTNSKMKISQLIRKIKLNKIKQR